MGSSSRILRFNSRALFKHLVAGISYESCVLNLRTTLLHVDMANLENGVCFVKVLLCLF
jgi:hypothetical protein